MAVFKAAIAILGLLLLVLLGVWLVVRWTGTSSGLAQQADAPDATMPDAASRPALPALDVAAPAQTETATFALG